MREEGRGKYCKANIREDRGKQQEKRRKLTDSRKGGKTMKVFEIKNHI